jgi:lysophospholipase L1-like esterase
MRLRLQRLAFLLLSLVFFLGVAEVASRLLTSDHYHVWAPGFQKQFRVHDKVVGIEGDSRLTINSFGVRGDEFSGANRYRLLAIGGSTTICSYLDDSETWPHLTQDRLNAVLGPDTAWIGNVGRAGHTTIQHLLQVEKLLPQHPEIDAVILLVGINDMLAFVGRMLEAKTGYRARSLSLREDPEAGMRIAFNVLPLPEDAPWYRRTFVGRVHKVLLEGLPRLPEGLPEQDEVGTLFLRAREMRSRAGSLHELPDVSETLSAYAKRLHEIIDRVEERGARVIFLTQPTLWRAGLSDSESSLLWMGGLPLNHSRPPAPYYTVESLAEGMARYNQTLLRVCLERGVDCVDLATTLPRDTSVFWDDAHFTEEGARRVAEAVARHLLATEPLRSMEPRSLEAPR